MENTKPVATVEIFGSNLMELASALDSMRIYALTANSGRGVHQAEIEIANQDGEELASVDLIEETLSDNSKVYNVRLRFSNVE